MRSDSDVRPRAHPALRTTQRLLLLLLGFSAPVLTVAALLAARTASAPFPGFFTEPTLVVNNIGSPSWSGYAAGLRLPDQILAVDGLPLGHPAALAEALLSRRPGEIVRLQVRNPTTGEIRQVLVPLVPFPPGVFLNFFLVPYGVGVLYWVVGGWLLLRHGREESGQVLALFCLTVALALGLYFDLYTTHRLFALWVPAIPLAGSALLHLAFVFPRPAPVVSRFPWLRVLFYLPALVLAAVGLVTTMNMARPIAYFGPWMWGRGWAGIGALVFIGRMVYHRVSARSPIVRAQAYIVLIGTLLSFLPFLVWIPLGFRPGFPFQPALCVPPLLLFPAAIALALYSPRALNVDWAIRRAAAHLLLTVPMVGLFFLAFFLLERWLFPTIGPFPPFLMALLALLAVLGVPPARALIQRAIDSLLLGRKVPPERALREFADRASTAHTFQDVVRHLADILQRALAPSWAVLYLRDPRAGAFIPHPLLGASAPLPVFPLDSSLPRRLQVDKRALYLAVDDNLPAELEGEEERLEVLGPALFVPLNEWGWLVVGPTRLERFRARDIWFLEALAPQVVAAVERVQRILEMGKWAQRLEGLNEVSQLLTSTPDLDTILRLTVRRAADLIHAEAASLLLVDEATGDLVFRVAFGVEGLEGTRLPAGTGIAGWVAREGRPARVADVRQDPRWYPEMDRRHAFTTRSLLCVPLMAHGRVIGVLEVLNRQDGQPFDEEDERLLSALAAHAASAVENARLFAAVDAANQAKTEFISFVSHELKQPMTAIKGYTDLLVKGLAGDLTEMQRSFLEVIRSNVNRMDTMVQELLDISRIESGRLRLEIGRVSVREAVEEAVRMLRQEIEAKGQRLEVTIAEAIPPVAADRARLVQILINLLSNAHRYTPEGGHIRITAEPADGYVRFSIADTGIGIAPEDQERLFTKFFRSQDPAVRSVPGTGLGLAITKSLVELQGGRIWAESWPGRGSIFSFTMPIYEEKGPKGTSVDPSGRKD